MKHFLKGTASVVIMIIISMVVNVFCNMHDIQLNTTVTTGVSTICALLIYHGLTKNEDHKDD